MSRLRGPDVPAQGKWQRSPVLAYVGVGANLGSPTQMVQSVPGRLGQWPELQVRAVSPLYHSAPLEAGGPDYVNAVLALETRWTAMRLLACLQELELAAGRERPYWHAPRTLDLDLLLYGDGSIQSPNLTVPHPRMMKRAFVLRPLADLAPDRVSAQTLERVGDQVCSRASDA